MEMDQVRRRDIGRLTAQRVLLGENAYGDFPYLNVSGSVQGSVELAASPFVISGSALREDPYRFALRGGVNYSAEPKADMDDLLDNIMDRLYGQHCGRAVVKCQHCGQWAARFCTCKQCGAPVD